MEIVYGVHAGVSRLAKLVFWIVIVTHILACFWHLIPQISSEPEINSWVYRHGIINATQAEKYVASVYWTFTTLTTVGFGDITAFTQQEKIYSLMVMAMGVTWYAFIVSSMSSIMAGFDTHNATMREKMNKLNSFMRDANLPRSLKDRLQDHLEQASFDKSNLYEADEILKEMPSVLRVEVLSFMYRKLINQIEYLKDKTPQFSVRVATSLRPLFVVAGDTIVEEGTHAEEMYFLCDGRATVIKNNRPIRTFQPGCFFGEVGCLLSDIRHASIIAETDCELYTLMKTDLVDIMADYPEFSIELRKRAVGQLKDDGERVKNSINQKENQKVKMRREAIMKAEGNEEDENYKISPKLNTFQVRRLKSSGSVDKIGTEMNDKIEKLSEDINSKLASIIDMLSAPIYD